ncbi:MAG: ribosomal RNA small subunit methyltransferase A [Verrucomicrobia bacterium]|nr:MAG: ribosomal RNA small subunit methyltransferase A [Verrucomicrobiota bacterium]
MSKILSPTQTYHILEELNHQPNKKLGQNFLIDKNIVKKSLTLANVQPHDKVVEIGPGLGTLSSALLEANVLLYAVEKDSTLADYLSNTIKPNFPNNFHLLTADALDFPIATLPILYFDNFKIIANLPYAIATPWLDLILSGPLPISMTLMLQKEAADRFCAKEGSKSFGAISIFLSSAFKKSNEHKVSRHCFYPEPNVDSTLLHLEKLPNPFIFHPKTKELIRFFFTQRRKQIGSLIKQLPPSDNLTSWLNFLSSKKFPTTTRPEDLPIHMWQQLDFHLSV